MDNVTSEICNLSNKNLIDPTGYDATMSAILIGLGAEKYINCFRKHNIGQLTLVELSDEDLRKLGVDDDKIRHKILKEVTYLPIYSEKKPQLPANLDFMQIVEVIEESTQHLYRIYLSLMANSLALKKKKVKDCLLLKDKYASNIANNTLSNMSNILNSMDIAMHSQIKNLSANSKSKKIDKILVGTVGSAVASILAVLFVRSLRNMKIN